MISHAQAVTAVAAELGVPPPAPNSDGDAVFALADDFSLAVRAISGDGGIVAWTSVTETGAPPEAATRFLRLHLARLGRNGGAPGAVATRGEDGALILFRRLEPADEGEWLDAVADLLNEAEALRKHMDPSGAGRAPGGTAAGGMMDLFRR